MDFWEHFSILLGLIPLECLEIAEDYFDLEDYEGLINEEDLEELQGYARASSLAMYMSGIPEGLKGRAALVCCATQAQYIYAVGGKWSLRLLAESYAEYVGSSPETILREMRRACKKGHGLTPCQVINLAIDLWRCIHEN